MACRHEVKDVRQKLLSLIQVSREVKMTSRGTASYKYTSEIYPEKKPSTNLFYFVDLTAALSSDL